MTLSELLPYIPYLILLGCLVSFVLGFAKKLIRLLFTGACIWLLWDLICYLW